MSQGSYPLFSPNSSSMPRVKFFARPEGATIP